MARRGVYPIFIPHLGCPNECVFCDQRRISGSPLPVAARDVTETLSALRESGGRGLELAFYGGSFTAVPVPEQEALLEAAQPFLADGTLCAIRLSTRPDAVDEEALRRLFRYGVKTVELGAQSMSDRVLAASGRGHTAADTARAARLVKDAGLALILQMMTGLPGSDADSDIETAQRLIALRPDGVRIYPTVIVRGTALEALWKSGRYREHTVADAVDVCAELVPLFEAAGVPVIRLGLNPTEELSDGAAVGGAYHPALGELVRSELLLRQARALLGGVPSGASVTLRVRPDRVSAMTGQHRHNIDVLTRELGAACVRVFPDEAAGEEIKAEWVNGAARA